MSLRFKMLLILFSVFSYSVVRANWFDGTDEEFEPYIAQYNDQNPTHKYALRFVRHERPGANPVTYQCSVISESVFFGLVPVHKDVSVFVNSKYWSKIDDKQTFINFLLNGCLN